MHESMPGHGTVGIEARFRVKCSIGGCIRTFEAWARDRVSAAEQFQAEGWRPVTSLHWECPVHVELREKGVAA